MGDGFYRSKDPTNSIKVLKEMLQKISKQHEQNCWLSQADHASAGAADCGGPKRLRFNWRTTVLAQFHKYTNIMINIIIM